MKHLLLTAALTTLTAWTAVPAFAQRAVPASATDSLSLPEIDFVSMPAASPYGQAPAAAHKTAARPAPEKVKPASGTFIDEPNLPAWVAFNWSWPWSVMGVDPKDMSETNLVDATDWPVTIHLRNGNFEGTYFSDNPGGTIMLQASHATNGLTNWQRTQFFSRDEYGRRPLRTAYDEHNDMMYGLSRMSYDDDSVFGFISFAPDTRLNPNTGAQVNPLSDIRIINGALPKRCECSALAWDPRDGNVIGVSVDGEVIRFDAKTGDYKVLFNTGHPNSTYFGGLAYSPSHRGFIWAYLVKDESGATASQDFYVIDTEGRTCKFLKSVPKGEDGMVHQISSLMINEHYSDPLGPQPVSVTDDSFELHADNGTLTVQIPSKAENGMTLTGTLKYYLRVDGITRTDGKSYIEADVTPGSVRTDRIEGLSDGLHRITIYTATSNGHWSRPLNIVKFTGYDTPETPQGVVLDSEYLSWEPVTDGVHGQDISADGIEYEVWVDEKKVGTTTNTSYRMDFDPTELLSHLAAVYAVNHDHVSQGGFSNRITVGKYRTVPTVFTPGASDVLLSTVNDPEGDDLSWAYNNYYEAWGKQYASRGGNDDWLFLPPLFFDDDKALYEISFDMLTKNYTEGLELRLCDETVAGSGTVIVDKQINTCDYGDAEAFVTVKTIVPASGVKYLAFHPTAMHADILVRNVRVSKTGSTTAAPAAITDLKVTPGERGALASTATFTFPSKTVAGEAIPADTDIRVDVSGVYKDFSTASATGKPGAQGQIVFTTAEGLTDVAAQPVVGENRGPLAQATFWAGEDVPGNVLNFTVTRTADPMIVSFSWDSPGTTGYHGGYANPSGLKYYLLAKKAGASKWTRFDPVDYTALSLTLNSDYAQTLTQFAVMTENAKGASGKWDPKDVTCGIAYTLPMRELMPGGTPEYNPVVIQTPTEEYTGTAGFANPAQLKPEYAVPSGKVIGMMPPADGSAGKAMLELPYFSTVGLTKPAFVAHALIDKDLTAQADIYVTAYGVDPVKIGSWNAETPGAGYTPLVFPLPESVLGKKWVQVYIDASFPGGEDRRFVVLERYSVLEPADNDLALLSVATPDHLRVNRPASVTASVCNNSATAKAAPSLSVSVTDNRGNTTLTDVMPDDLSPIGPDCERAYTFTLTPDADMLGDMKFALALPDDEVSANNRHEASASVEPGDAMMCTTLNAARDAGDPTRVHLDWNEPYIFSGTEDMEQMASFDMGRNLGSFTNLDLDGTITYTWENWDFPGEEDPHGFLVFDASWYQIPSGSLGTLSAHSGDKYLMALSPVNYVTANDWLISPEVESGSEVSFWVNSISTKYGPDMVGLLYSDGSENPDDFQMLQYLRKTTEGWEQVTATLPAEARRFAIRYYSNDTFGIMIDDIAYTPAGGIPTLYGFELERNGQPLQSFDTPRYSHTDTGVGDEAQSYRVYPRLMQPDGSIARGEASPTARVAASSSLSATDADSIRVSVSGHTVEVTGLQGETAVSLVTPEGLSMPAAALTADKATWHVSAGIYMLRAGNRTWKLNIR